MFALLMRHLVIVLGLVPSCLFACGRPATLGECNEIVTRTAALEYQSAAKSHGPVDPGQIETIRARVKDSMLKNCVGKRITSKALRCVREAKSAKEIEERCFD
jgi:hypothetical protein